MGGTVLVLGIGPLRDRFFVTAARLGLRTLLVEDSAYSRYDRVCDEAYPWRIWDHGRPGPELGRLDGFRGRVDGVLALNDWATPIAARLAAEWGLPGAGDAVAGRGHDKLAVRRALAAAGVDDTRYGEVRTGADLEAFFAAARTPSAVLKPLDGGASLGVRHTSSAADAVAVLPEVLAVSGRDSALVEEYLDGPEYSLEAVVRGAEVRAVVVTEKVSSGAPRFIELRHVVSAAQDELHRGEAVAFVQRLTDALQVADAVLHVEAKHTPRGWQLIEIALRPAGGLITDLVRHAHGIDLYAEQLRLSLGLPAEVAPAERPLHAGVQFTAGCGVIADFPSVAPVVDGLDTVRCAERLLPPDVKIPDVDANWWRSGYVLGVAADRDRLERQLGQAADRLMRLLDLQPMPFPAAADRA
jgi:cysteine synthase A